MTEGFIENLALSAEILDDYPKRDSTVDNGNLYFAATTYQVAYEAEKRLSEKYKNCYERMVGAYDILKSCLDEKDKGE